MKALPDSEDKSDRRLSIDSQWKVKTCNNMKDFDSDVDFDYYVDEVEKLLIKKPTQEQTTVV